MGRPEDAKAELQAVLKREEGNRGALLLLAELYAGQRKFDDALATYDQLLAHAPNDAEALYRKGMLLVALKKADEALAVAKTMTDKNPNNPFGFSLRGTALFSKGSYDDAIIALQKAASMQPQPGVYYQLALAHLQKKGLEQALGQVQKAIDLAPNFAQARMLLAVILLKKDRVDESINEARKAIELDEDNAAAHNVLGSAYLAKGRFSEGMAEINRAIALDPNLADARVKKGLLELRRGKFHEGEEELLAAIHAGPEVMNPRIVLASAYLQRSEFAKADKLLREGLTGTKADASLYNLLAEAAMRQNKIDDAVTAFQNAKQADPLDDNAYFRLSLIYILKGEQDKGEQEITALLERVPDHTRALITAAQLSEARGRDSDALKYLDRARATGRIEGYMESAAYYLRKRQENKALDMIAEAIRKYPSNPAPYELKGRIQLAQKNYQDAARTFEDLEKIQPRTGFPYALNAYLAAGNYERALDKVKRELTLQPGSAELKGDLSRVYLAMGRKQEAMETAREVIQGNPDSPVGYLALSMVHQRSNELDKAIEVLRGAKSRDVSIPMMLGNLHAVKRDYAAALQAYRKAEQIKAGYVPAIVQQAMVLQMQGNRKAAVAEYQRVLRLAPSHVPALNNLAYIYADQDQDLSQALQYATRAYILAPRDGSVNDTLGYVLLKKGKTEEAVKVLKQAESLLPDNATVLYHLGLAYKTRGEVKLAEETLQKAVRIGNFPEEKSAKDLLAKLKRS
jgi:putative PEP-CTERM system TPR-repeat lipoprotein